ncbi:MAG: ChrR family anti-sigma-E factor [Paracoccaceae bacterium]|nr:ChrR family anti-sigma-E factor [Paracoccaceae bacterium]
MTVMHHPSDEFLLDYASGAQGEAWSLAVATHLALCTICRCTVGQMEVLAGSLLAATDPEPVSDELLSSVLAGIDNVEKEPNKQSVPILINDLAPQLPQPLRGYLGSDVNQLKWKKLGIGASQLLIPTSSAEATARLLKIPAGKSVPQHSHGGLELTLVLAGAFSDSTGTYSRGDLQEADESTLHQPQAASGDDCICLAITNAPLRLKSFAGRMVQPFLGI